jgi:Emfourin
MSSLFRGVSTPLLLGGVAILAIVVGVVVAFALGSGDDSADSPDPTPTATGAAATPTATATPPSPTASSQPATPVAPSATVAVSEIWSIDFQRTGGFAGLSQSLSISSDGQATFKDMRSELTKTGSLEAADLAELRTLIDSSGFFSQSTPQNAPCADCFNLSIVVTLDGQTHSVEAVDIGLDSALKPLADRLVALLQDGLSQ